MDDRKKSLGTIERNNLLLITYFIQLNNASTKTETLVHVNLDMTDSVGPGKLVRHMQNPSYTYDEYLICIGMGPSILSVICKDPSYSGPSYPSSPVYVIICITCEKNINKMHFWKILG